MAPTDLLRLEWFCCLDGYRLEDRVDPPGRRALLLSAAGRYIVRASSRLGLTTPLQHNGLYRILADVSDDESALAFVKAHGFLNGAKAKDKPVGDVLDAAAAMRWLVDAIDKKRWAALTDALNRAEQDYVIFETGGIGRLGAVFDWQEGMERPNLHFRPGSLLGAIYLQALQDASGGAELQKCDRPGCPKYFQVGPGTGRPRLNRDVAYCTPKCQKAHAYMKRKEPES